MKKTLSVLTSMLFVIWTVSVPISLSAECTRGQINGDAGVSYMDIDCGQGHDCNIQVCEGCVECCCVEDGGTLTCPYCNDFQECTMVTQGCA